MGQFQIPTTTEINKLLNERILQIKITLYVISFYNKGILNES